MIRRAASGIFLVAAACTGADSRGPDTTKAAPARIEVGAPAPAYAATSLAGDSVSLAGLRGKVVLMNVWATWCGPCRKEIPELRALHTKYKDRGLEVVGISVDAEGTDDAIRSFLQEFKMDYPIWRDPNEGVSSLFRLAGVPATLLIDRSGVIRWRATGAIEPRDTTLSGAIERAIESRD
jgi:cytochrome c-type biogenesis protein